MSNMDDVLKTRLSANGCKYKISLERIIEKYSKLQYQDGGVEVDLDTTSLQALERHMRQSKAEISKLELKSLNDVREESMRDVSCATAPDATRDSQLDFTNEDHETSETRLSVEDDASCRINSTVSSSEESLRNVSAVAVQPEDGDEDLELSLRSHGSSLVELYPDMIGRIGRAWRRRHVSEAAGSVLRRYRRWRRRTGRGGGLGNDTFVVAVRCAGRNSEEEEKEEEEEEETRNSPVKRQFIRAVTDPRSPFRTLNHVQQQQSPLRTLNRVQQQQSPFRTLNRVQQQQQSPLRTLNRVQQQQSPLRTLNRVQQQQSPRRLRWDQPQPVLVMDLSGPSETFESSLNETFAVSEASRLGDRPSPCAASPSRPRRPVAYAVETAEERLAVYGSPVKKRMMMDMETSLSRSPHGFPRSPKTYSGESFPREPWRPRITPAPPHNPAVPLRILHPQDGHPSLRPQQPRSPQSPAAPSGRRPGLRRHLSFDSSLPSIRVSDSPKKVDEDFLKLYHKFVCQSKSSFFNRHPCRLCASRGPSSSSSSSSSSSLAALALSPHRSLLRKRHRELDRDGHPRSKRYRDERSLSSPGSQRHGKEVLRRLLSPPAECGLSRGAAFQRFDPRQRAADQDAWMSRRGHASAADCSGTGSSLSRCFSPRKW